MIKTAKYEHKIINRKDKKPTSIHNLGWMEVDRRVDPWSGQAKDYEKSLKIPKG